MSRLMSSMLVKAGCFVSTAVWADEVAAILDGLYHDLMVVDVWRSPVAVMDVVQANARRDPDTRIVLSSGFAALWYRAPRHDCDLASFSQSFHLSRLSAEVGSRFAGLYALS